MSTGSTRTRLLWLGIGALAFGLTQVDTSAIGLVDTKVAQALLQRAWSEPAATHGAECLAHDGRRPCPVARLSIPKHGTERIVLKQTGDSVPAGGWGHLAGTPLPGGSGNTVFWSYAPEDAAMLQQLRPGDTLVIELPDATRFAYRVTETRTSDWHTVRVDFGKSGAALTLVSRSGAGDAQTVVSATLLPALRAAVATWPPVPSPARSGRA